MSKASMQTIYRKNYQPPAYLIKTVTLHFMLDAKNTQVIANLQIHKNPASQNTTTLTLLGENLLLKTVALDGVMLATKEFQLDAEKLIINSVPQNRPFSIRIENQISPQTNTALEGLYLSKSMLCTQCEAEGFRHITYFLDRPDVMARFTTTLVGNKKQYPVMLANGNKIACGQLQGDRHWVTWEDPFAKPCYLFALVAGHLQVIKDNFVTLSGRNISLEIFVEAHNADKCAHAIQALQHAMRWDEQVYGREYDLNLYMIVAVSHFNMGAMENKGLNIFNSKFVLARPDTATDTDYMQIKSVIAHEYFHNWTGNRITCRDWFQLSLKEGLTVFRDQEFSSDLHSRAVKRIEDVRLLKTHQFAEDAGPLAHSIRPDSYIEINNFYTLTVYEKGAEVVRMLHTLLGVAGFRKGSDLYFQRHDGQAVTCDDFILAMENANNINLKQFRRWYSQVGTPTLSVHTKYDKQTQTFTLHCHQSCTTKKPLHIPVRLGFLATDGTIKRFNFNDDVAVDEVVLQLTKTQQSFVFSALNEPPVMSLLRGFSAPIKLNYPRSLEQLAFLARYDSDAFNRWDAGQQLAATIILGLVSDYQNGNKLKLNPIMEATFKATLEHSGDDLTYLALLLSLPTINYLAELMQVIDIVAINHAREFVLQVLAKSMQDKLWHLYQRHNHPEPNCLNAQAMGSRRLKNTCLGYLAKLDNSKYYQCTEQQFHLAQNMTDQLAALSVIVNSHHPARQQCLNSFYQQWHQDDLVVDKWFTLQATCTLDNAFSNVQHLMQHEAFNHKNPNRVRALIAEFCQNNPLHFHAKNGEGYQFLAEQTIILGKINPQIAARLSVALVFWRRFDPCRQKKMLSQLKRIINSPEICKDVYEIVSKSLANAT